MKNAHAQRRRRFVRRLNRRHADPGHMSYVDQLTPKECRTTKRFQRSILRLIEHGARMWNGASA